MKIKLLIFLVSLLFSKGLTAQDNTSMEHYMVKAIYENNHAKQKQYLDTDMLELNKRIKYYNVTTTPLGHALIHSTVKCEVLTELWKKTKNPTNSILPDYALMQYQSNFLKSDRDPFLCLSKFPDYPKKIQVSRGKNRFNNKIKSSRFQKDKDYIYSLGFTYDDLTVNKMKVDKYNKKFYTALKTADTIFFKYPFF